MNTATESEKNASSLEVPQPKTKRIPAKKAKPAKKTARAKIAAGKPKSGPRQQEGRGHRNDETRQGRKPG